MNKVSNINKEDIILIRENGHEHEKSIIFHQPTENNVLYKQGFPKFQTSRKFDRTQHFIRKRIFPIFHY